MIDKRHYKQKVKVTESSKEISIDDSEKLRNIESQLDNKSSLATMDQSLQQNTPMPEELTTVDSSKIRIANESQKMSSSSTNTDKIQTGCVTKYVTRKVIQKQESLPFIQIDSSTIPMAANKK